MFVSAKLAFSTTGYAGFEACGEGVLATAVKQEPLERGDPCPKPDLSRDSPSLRKERMSITR